MNKSHLFCFLLTFLACANPIMPTGGPPDQTAPKLLKSQPESGTVNFSNSSVRFEFDEYVTQQSFKQAFSLEPNFDIKFDIEFSGKSVDVNFKSQLPPNSTLILKLSTQLSDFKGNKIKAPMSVALSTGERVNTGKVESFVYDAFSGKKVSNVNLFLFKENQLSSEKAYYVADSDSSGKVVFNYLADGNYRIALVEDLNRNRTIDSFDWVQASYEPFISVLQDSVSITSSIYYSKPDTVLPELNGIGVLSGTRLRLRFSESVLIQEPKQTFVYSALDSIRLKLAYLDSDDSSIIWAITDSTLIKDELYTIKDLPISDVYGNRFNSSEITFTGEDKADTTQLKVILVEPKLSLTESDTIKVIYNGMISNSIKDSLIVIQAENQLQNYSFSHISDNRLVVYPETSWDKSTPYQFRFYNPLTFNYYNYKPEIKSNDQLGNLELTFETKDSIHVPIYVEVFGDSFYQKSQIMDSVLVLSSIVDKNVTVRAFLDSNKNGKWDRGQFEPYIQPEPFFVKSSVSIAEKMTNTLLIDWKALK